MRRYLAMALALTLLAAGCGKPQKPAPSGAGLPSAELAEGFPVYANSLLSMMIQSVDAAILEQERLLLALAALPQVQSGEWTSMENTLAPFQRAWGDGGVYWFALPDGRYYTVEKGLVDQTLADRPYFPDLQAGKTVVGSLVVSRSTGMKSAVIAVPILDGGNRVIGALGASLFLEKLDKTLAAAMSLPEGMLFYALGPDGTTVLHQNLGLVFDNPLGRYSPSLKAAAEKMLASVSGEAEYEFNGFRKRVRYAASTLNGWRYVIGINVAKLAS